MNPSTAAQLAHAAYGSDSHIVSVSQSVGFDNALIFERQQTRAFVAFNDSRMAVVFRGTKTWRHWAYNFDFRKVEHRNAKGHAGFLAELNHVWDDVESTVFDLIANGIHKHHWIGHSKGGGEANWGVARMLQNALDAMHSGRHKRASRLWPNGLQTFGCPRVFTPRTANTISTLMEGRISRWCSPNDLVAHMPLKQTGFDHAGPESLLPPHGQPVVNPGPLTRAKAMAGSLTADTKRQKKWIGKLRAAIREGGADHSMGLYAWKLAQLYGKTG